VLHLFPLGETAQTCNASADLEVEFTPKYPITPPVMKIPKSKGLSAAQVKDLQALIEEQLKPLHGREVVFEITGHVQAFLAMHNTVRVTKSFYEEMTDRQAKEKQLKEQEQHQREQSKAQQEQALGTKIDDTVRRKEEALKEETRRRNEFMPVVSTSEEAHSERQVGSPNQRCFTEPYRRSQS